MKTSLIASIVLISLSGCAGIESAKAVAPKIADKAVDASYGIVCGMPYQTEWRFLVRKKLARETIQKFCDREYQR
ncbi:hypothetical protein KAR91_54635 [Candidatus Pacearchaeota archaeon]|nr:hypothetical protein [Candidatus Pacearchaeota archaeon]